LTVPVTAAIALGSNQGDRRAHIEAALRALASLPGTRLIACSPLIETAPVGMREGEGSFLNAAALVETLLAPRDLLDRLLEIEREHGRVRDAAGGWGGRTLDLDLLTCGDMVIDEPGLRVPHPRMHQRLFVLEPLAAIAPGLLIPTLNRSVSRLLEELNRSSRPLPEGTA
jgi:2-amino-4-hydroxy-6-hydroxymethyldihydropteridine diphosphokinase